jgi:hypothetical protein
VDLRFGLSSANLYQCSESGVEKRVCCSFAYYETNSVENYFFIEPFISENAPMIRTSSAPRKRRLTWAISTSTELCWEAFQKVRLFYLKLRNHIFEFNPNEHSQLSTGLCCRLPRFSCYFVAYLQRSISLPTKFVKNRHNDSLRSALA